MFVESLVAGHEAVTQKPASVQYNTCKGTEMQVHKSNCFPLNDRWCIDATGQWWNPGKLSFLNNNVAHNLAKY
eukprot:2516408-Ditylum_brightwellii.AAC.1